MSFDKFFSKLEDTVFFEPAMEAEVDILADNSEKKAFPKTDDVEDVDIDDIPEASDEEVEEEDSDPDETEEEDPDVIEGEVEEEIPTEPVATPQEETLKSDMKERMMTLYTIINSNIDILSRAPAEKSMHNIEQFSDMLEKLNKLKVLLGRFTTEDEFLNKDYATYTKYYVTTNEIHDIVISMVKKYFDEANKKEKNEKDSKKVK